MISQPEHKILEILRVCNCYNFVYEAGMSHENWRRHVGGVIDENVGLQQAYFRIIDE